MGKKGRRIITNSLNIVGVGSSMRQEPYGTMLPYSYQVGDDILRMKGIGVDYIMFDYVFAPIASNVADIISYHIICNLELSNSFLNSLGKSVYKSCGR